MAGNGQTRLAMGVVMVNRREQQLLRCLRPPSISLLVWSRSSPQSVSTADQHSWDPNFDFDPHVFGPLP